MRDEVLHLTKGNIPPISRYFSEKSDFQCVHGVPFDSECGECIEDAQIVNVGKERSCKEKLDSSINNGGKTDYYQLENAPFPIKDFDDFAEWRGMNGNQFNIGKVAWTFNCGRHSGTDYERDLNKIIHYAQRELLRLNR